MQKVTFTIFAIIISILSVNAQIDDILNRHVSHNYSSEPALYTTTVTPTFTEPDCTPPKDFSVVRNGAGTVFLSWTGIPAMPGKAYYKVRYRPEKGSIAWAEEDILSGNQYIVEGLDAGRKYKFEIQKVCIWKEINPVYSNWVAEETLTAGKITLPSFNCGDEYIYPTINCDSTNQIADPNANIDIFYMGGFPVEVIQISSDTGWNEQGVMEIQWTGTGLVPLPFGVDKYATVEFSSIVVNLDYQVCATRGIFAIRDQEPNLPNLEPSEGYGNNEICIPPPSTEGFDDSTGLHSLTGLPWDPYGFGPNGTYIRQPPYEGYVPGFPMDTTLIYDPNGFDSAGVNAITGTLFNPQGCNRDGLDSLGQICDPNIPPYSWMDPSNSNPPSPAGLAFAATILDTLNDLLITALNQLSSANNILLTAKAAQCDSLRTEMNANLTTSGLSSEFLFGENGEYFNVGMHLNFSALPEPMAEGSWMDLSINPAVKALEQQHIYLYTCDKLQYEFIYIQEIISAFLGSDLPELRSVILEKIKKQPETQINKFIADPEYFFKWLKDQVKLEVQYSYIELHGPGTTSIENENFEIQNFTSPDKRKNYNSPSKNRGSVSGYLASDDPTFELLRQSAEVRYEDLNFEYQQGFRMINGVNRAFYLEAIAGERARGTGETQANPYLMPIELLSYGEDGKGYRVYLDNIMFNPNSPATMDAYIVIDVPTNGSRIVFEAHEIQFTPKGLLLSNGIKLELSEDIPLRLNNNARMVIKANENTYVAMDCLGFAGMGIQADVELCRNIVKPIDPNTEKVLAEPKMVHGTFTTILPSLSSLYIDFIVDPFVITGAEDVKWKVDTITLDLSEALSPVGTPPVGYNTQLAGPWGFSPLWKGFYAKNIEVSLPKKFKKDSSALVVGVHDLMIDPMGVSCSVSASNILPLSEGSADGWGMSVDEFELTVLMSTINKAQFDGKIHVPLFKDSTNTTNTLLPEDCFNYSALIQPGGNYQFSVSQQAGVVYAADMWKAGSVHITSSLIELQYANDSFFVVARLNGDIKVNDNITQNVKVNIPKITFQQLEISNRAPYFSPGTWGFPISIGPKFAGFELGFRNIEMVKTVDGEPCLNFDAHVLISDDTTKIGATGGFGLVGELEVINGEQHWKYKKLKVHDVDVNGSFAGVATVQGFAIFFEGDPVFGTGFRGGLKAKFDLMSSEVNVVGQFGRVNDFKYFMIDAMYCAAPGSGINLAGAFELTGIGGGVFYHMLRPNSAVSFASCGNPIPTQLGSSLSGIVYTPTDTVILGIKLTVAGATVGLDEAFNANASIEFQFGTGGSLDKIWLNGNGRFMAPIDINGLPAFVKNQVPFNSAAVSANVDIELDFKNKQFTGKLETYMNIAGVLRGISTNPPNRMCFAEVKFSESEWYIKIGGPADSMRAGIVVTIPGMKSKEPLLTFRSYLQVGNNIDPLPPLPEDILDLLGDSGVDNQYDSQRSTSQLDGFAFGVDVEMGGHFKFLVLYADLDAHFGFDVNVAKTTPAMLCNNQPFGINGWYAQGQIYAALEVEMGLEVKVFGNKKQFTIMKAGIGAALEAKLPNPFWAHGAVGYNYNLLNGLVKGEGNFDFEVGEKCVFSSQGSLADVPVILDVRPDIGSLNVSVDKMPSATFNFPVDEEFSFEDLGGSNNVFKVSLDTMKLYWRNYEIPTRNTVFSNGRKKATIIPQSFLPGQDTIRMLVSVHVDSNGVTINRERRDVWFITGEGKKTISPSNVKGSYPLDGQYNFYRDELTNHKGYIQLDRAQPDVMLEDEDYIKVVRYRQSGGGCQFYKLTFSGENYWEKKLEFPLPEDGFFQSNSVYEMQIVDYPKDDSNWGPNYTGLAPCICNGCIPPVITPPTPPFGGVLVPTLAESDGPVIPPVVVPAVNTPPAERIVYSAYFRVSEYNKFSDKMAALQTSAPKPVKNSGAEDQVFLTLPDVVIFNVDIEPFDWYDVNSGGKPQLLSTTQSSYYTGSSSIWTTGIAWFYRFPFENPNINNITFPDGQVAVFSPPSQPLSNTVSISGANSTGLRITKNHFIGGVPANFITEDQKIVISAGLAVKNGSSSFQNAYAEKMTPGNKATITGACGSNQICQCTPNPWSLFQHLMCNDATSGSKVFPVQFKYALPGTEQTTGYYITNLTN